MFINSLKNSIRRIKYSYHNIETLFYYYFSFLKKTKIPHADAIAYLQDLRPNNNNHPQISFSKINCDLSIIIPVYNAEKYLSTCLDSVINQKTELNFEIIIINDGSTDKSLKIIQEKSHPKLRIYSIANSGVSLARNYGLSQANGKYIMFVDADDQLLPSAVNILMENAINQDACIVQGNYYLSFENGNPQRLAHPNGHIKTFNTKDQPAHILSMEGYPWGKVFKRDLFVNAAFPVYVFEDTLIWLIIYRRAKSIVIIPDPVYLYTIQKDSESGRISAGSVKGIDTFYIVPYLISMNQQLGLTFDEIFYKQILNQFSKIMYDRNFRLGDKALIALLIAAKNILQQHEKYCPPNLSKKEKYFKKAILNSNLELYKRTVFYLK